MIDKGRRLYHLLPIAGVRHIPGRHRPGARTLRRVDQARARTGAFGKALPDQSVNGIRTAGDRSRRPQARPRSRSPSA